MCNNNPSQVIASRMFSQSPVTGDALTSDRWVTRLRHKAPCGGRKWSRLWEDQEGGWELVQPQCEVQFLSLQCDAGGTKAPAMVCQDFSFTGRGPAFSASREVRGHSHSRGPWVSGPLRSAQWPCPDQTLKSSEAPGVKLSVHPSQPSPHAPWG